MYRNDRASDNIDSFSHLTFNKAPNYIDFVPNKNYNVYQKRHQLRALCLLHKKQNMFGK